MATPIEAGAYGEALVYLATAGLVVPLFHRLRISPIIGFLLAGVVLGPFGLGRFAEDVPWLSAVTFAGQADIALLAELGVVFLLFVIGLELSWSRLVLMRRLVFGLGSLQVAASALVLGGIGAILGLDASSALLVGSALALSSTAIVIPALAERRRLASPAGRATFSVLLMQDLMVAPLLFMVGMMAAREADLGLGSLTTVVTAAAMLVIIVVGGRVVLRPLFHWVGATRSTELFAAACLFVVIGTGLIAASSGLSMALGGFVAGILLAETEFRRQIEHTIDPFKGLLLGLFFVSIGVGLDLGRLFADPLTVLAVAAGLIVVKAALAWPLVRAFGFSPGAASEAALLLAPGGEFAFVLIGAALAAGILPADVGSIVVVAVTLTMLAIPALARAGERVGRRASHAAALDAAPPVPDDDLPRVLVVGYGRVGRLVCDMLARHDIPFLAIDLDVRHVGFAHRMGQPVHYGDATDTAFLARCGLAHARAVVVTTDAPAAAEAIVRAVRAERPDLPILARARDASHATKLYGLGATDAVPETVEASLQLAENVLVDLGVPMGRVIASIHERRDEFRRELGRGDGRLSRAVRRSTRS